MKLKFQEKRLLTLFFLTLIINAITAIIGSVFLTDSLFTLTTLFGIITLALEVTLIVFSIKEIKRGNKALGILVLVLAIIDILALILGFISGFIAGYSAL